MNLDLTTVCQTEHKLTLGGKVGVVCMCVVVLIGVKRWEDEEEEEEDLDTVILMADLTDAVESRQREFNESDLLLPIAYCERTTSLQYCIHSFSNQSVPKIPLEKQKSGR